MIYEIDNLPTEINFAPSDERAEIIQNIKTILQTISGTCPLMREFGISADNLDLPINLAQTMLAAEIARQINLYEPRAVLKKINAEKNLDGKLKITVQIEV